MSEFEKKKNLTPGKNGFLNCQLCPRRFISLIGFENHSNLEHNDVALNHLEIQKVKIGIPNHVFDESLAKQNDHESLQESSHLLISVLEKKKPKELYEWKYSPMEKEENLITAETDLEKRSLAELINCKNSAEVKSKHNATINPVRSLQCHLYK